MSRLRIPLQFRIILLLGCALTALQLLLGAGFVATVDDSIAMRREMLRSATQDAIEGRVRQAAAVQVSSLELIAELGRQQNYVIVEEQVTQTREQRSGPRRLQGSRVKQEVTTTRHHLEDLVDGLTEYSGASMILWLLTEAGSLEALSDVQQDQAIRLEAETRGTASRLFCNADGCQLMTVRPFQTRDDVQVTAVQAVELGAMLPAAEAGGEALSWRPVGDEASASPAPSAHSWIGPLTALGGIALDSGAIYAALPASEEIARFLEARDRYIQIAAGGVLLSLLLIAISLRGVLSRVGVLIEALPMLTEQRFDDARAKLSGAVRRSRGRDETEVMLQVAADVSTQLQGLTEELQLKAGELAAERDRMALLLDTVPAFVLLVDAQGRIHAANALCCESIGMSERQILEQPLKALMPADDHARFERAVGAVARAASSRSLEAKLQDPTGSQLDVDWQLRPVEDPQSGARLVLAAGQDVTDLRVMEHRFHWLRDHDELTGLLNGEALYRRIQSATRPGVLAYLLLQREQVIRAALPEAGRSALARHVAEVLQSASRAQDKQWLAILADRTVAVYIPDADVAEAVVADFSARLQAQPLQFEDAVFELALQPVYVRLQGDESPDVLQDLLAGCETRPESGESPWLEAADAVSRQHQEHRSWVREIDLALDEGRLYLEYQPIFNLPGLQASHSEALVRMRGRDGERVPPGLFIPHAERSGQIIDLERQVFDMAIAKSVQMREAGQRHPLAVNLAAASLHDDVLLQRLERATQDESLPFGSLCLEIVETEAIRNLDAARSLLQRFKSRGMQIALDDFGVGFTSFEYVRELPFDTIKIDQAFVRELSRRPQDRKLIASINELVQGLGRKTIAEGVEDQVALRILKDIGVDAVQGYYLGRPEPEIRLQPLAGFESAEAQVA